jgi:16S rRNA (uracil1498-N3)-methyltransferase
MHIRRFFADQIINHKEIIVSGDEFHHLKTVLRCSPGDQVEVVNGAGSLYIADIKAIKKNEAFLKIISHEYQERKPPQISIAVSVLKKRPMNLLIEKLTEIGVDQIIPLQLKRTDEVFSLSSIKKWEKIACQSLKINKNLWIPEILPIHSKDQMIAKTANFQTKLILLIDGDAPQAIRYKPPLTAVIGPAGDFDTEEIEYFKENNFRGLTINGNILKAETAAISIAAIIRYHLL